MRLWLSIAAVVVVTLIAILLVPEDASEEEVQAIPSPAHESAAGKASMPGEIPPAGSPPEQVESGPTAEPEPPLAEVPPTPSATGPEGSAARAFLAGASDPTPEELVARAREFQQQGLAGDAWLLYFKAAREGDGAAALELGRQADPALFDPQVSALSRPDLVQAHKWYSLAARAGNREAAERLEALLRNLEQAADRGDERAALLLQEWKTR